MAVAPVSGAVGVTVEVQGSATGAAGPGSTTGVEWLVAPWQELPGPRSPRGLGPDDRLDCGGHRGEGPDGGRGGVPPPDAAVAEGAQQKNTATRASSQPSTTAGVNPPRLRSVRSVRLVIAAIVR